MMRAFIWYAVVMFVLTMILLFVTLVSGFGHLFFAKDEKPVCSEFRIYFEDKPIVDTTLKDRTLK